jgi:hypothetical protein
MPIEIINNDGSVSLQDLQQKMTDGYSVVKSPHVGNQHPSNLVCAALGIPLNVVTFTSGERDKNFHPHLQIKDGVGTQISDPSVWTPFSVSTCGAAIEDVHAGSIQQRFPKLSIQSDCGLMTTHQALAETVLRVITTTTQRLWYREVSTDGVVTKHRGEAVADWDHISRDVFRVSNDTAGWVIPNRAHILFEFVLQSLESGRDSIYHLSGPQMVGYICGVQKTLSKSYDVLRKELPILPETLQVHVVPVASARMVTHKNNSVAFDALENTLRWYEGLVPEAKRSAVVQFKALTTLFPEFTDSIEAGTFMSQYDIESADDLLISDWMLETPLKRVEGVYRQLLRSCA